jgi:hypothetical protein
MLLTTSLILLILGLIVWLFGDRMWLLGAGAGALLGYGLMTLFPSLADGTIGVILVVGLAIALGALGFMGKVAASLISMGFGFVVGGALALSFLDMLGLGTGIEWLIALIAGVIVALIFRQFLDWALILFASLLGSMLIVRGALGSVDNTMDGTMSTLVVLALTGLGVFYHYRKKKPAAPPAAPAAPPSAAPPPATGV